MKQTNYKFYCFFLLEFWLFKLLDLRKDSQIQTELVKEIQISFANLDQIQIQTKLFKIIFIPQITWMELKQTSIKTFFYASQQLASFYSFHLIICKVLLTWFDLKNEYIMFSDSCIQYLLVNNFLLTFNQNFKWYNY